MLNLRVTGFHVTVELGVLVKWLVAAYEMLFTTFPLESVIVPPAFSTNRVLSTAYLIADARSGVLNPYGVLAVVTGVVSKPIPFAGAYERYEPGGIMHGYNLPLGRFVTGVGS
jgi:hypothetical protein